MAAAEYYAFVMFGGEVVACLYDAAGGYIEDLCAPMSDAGIDPVDGSFILIPTDSEGFVADGSIAAIEPVEGTAEDPQIA